MTIVEAKRTHSLRVGASLVEILIVVAILALFLGLLLPAVQQVRQTAQVMQTLNQEKQIILAVHQISTDRDDQIRNMPKNTLRPKPIYTEQSVFTLILPYIHPPLVEPKPGAPEDEVWAYLAPQVKLFRDPQYPSWDSHDSITGFHGSRRCRASYAANLMAFDGFLSLTSSVPDGQSNTIAFSTHYYNCGTEQATERSGCMYWDKRSPFFGGDRRASFADAGGKDVMPVRDTTTGQTVPSRASATFEVRPPWAEADARLPHAFFARGVQVALFDGSARTIRPSVDPSVFWSAVTPNWGEVTQLPD